MTNTQDTTTPSDEELASPPEPTELEKALEASLIEAELPDDEVEDDLKPVTAAQLVAELKEKNYRAIQKAEDRQRMDEQFAQGVINPIILARWLGIQPQMVYGAIRDGKLQSTKENNTQKLYVQRADALKWAAKYLTGKQARDAVKAAKEAIEAAEGA